MGLQLFISTFRNCDPMDLLHQCLLLLLLLLLLSLSLSLSSVASSEILSANRHLNGLKSQIIEKLNQSSNLKETNQTIEEAQNLNWVGLYTE